MEVPIVAHRVRKAAGKGASVAFLNPAVYEYYFKPAAYVTAAPDAFVANLAAVLAAAASAAGTTVPAHLARAVEGVDRHGRASRGGASARRARRRSCCSATSRSVIRSTRRCARSRPALAAVTGATLGYLSEGANAAGAALAGATPHRGPGGQRCRALGLRRAARCSRRRVTPTSCSASSRRRIWPKAPRRCLRCAAPPSSPSRRSSPTSCSTSRTCCCRSARSPRRRARSSMPRAAGRASTPPPTCIGDARPGWRVLRVLGNELELPNCEYRTPSDVVADARTRARQTERALPPAETQYKGSFTSSGRPPGGGRRRARGADLRVDALVRRSEPLQETVLGARQGAA